MFTMHANVDAILAASNRFEAVKGKMQPLLAQIVQQVGPEAEGHMKRVLPAQTGLKFKTINKALKGKGRGARYEIKSAGGNIRLKFFNARETAKGVTAAPWNSRRLYAGTFIKSGWWPKRGKAVAGGHVMMRVGKAKLPITQVRSGLYIAEEMITGNSAAVFYGTVNARLAPAVEAVLLKAL